MIRRPPRSTLFPYTNALPICVEAGGHRGTFDPAQDRMMGTFALVRVLARNTALPVIAAGGIMDGEGIAADRKSTRLNSSHSQISYAVFCLKKKNKRNRMSMQH